MMKRLGDIAEFINGGAWSDKEYTDNGIPVVKVTNLKNGSVDLSEVNYIPESSLDKYGRHILRKGDLVIATVGSHPNLVASAAGRATIIPSIAEGALLNQNALCIRTNNEFLNQGYLGYLGKSDLFQGYVKSVGRGAANQVRIALGLIKEFSFELPPLPTQRKIASILSAYDDLIENNLKRIKLLEEKAFLSYKQIVREEKMEVEDKLENLIQTVKRKAKIPKADYIEKGDFPIIDQSTDFIGGYTNEKEAVYEHLPMIVFGDHTRILKYINFPFACGADGTQLVKPENPSISVAYLYFELISCNLSNYHYARHFKFLKEQVIKLPSEKVMLEYKEETDKVFNLIQLLRLQNTKLREARDILLPKLMNGQIEV
jgi:type I restriction enzyme S subunit